MVRSRAFNLKAVGEETREGFRDEGTDVVKRLGGFRSGLWSGGALLDIAVLFLLVS